jgi:hypothetical protein
MSTLIIGDRIIRTSDPILQRKQAAQGMQQAGIGSLSGRTTDDDRGRQAREIQRDAPGGRTITEDSARDYDENTERLIAQAKAERGIIDKSKKTTGTGIDTVIENIINRAKGVDFTFPGVLGAFQNLTKEIRPTADSFKNKNFLAVLENEFRKGNFNRDEYYDTYKDLIDEVFDVGLGGMDAEEMFNTQTVGAFNEAVAGDLGSDIQQRVDPIGFGRELLDRGGPQTSGQAEEFAKIDLSQLTNSPEDRRLAAAVMEARALAADKQSRQDANMAQASPAFAPPTAPAPGTPAPPPPTYPGFPGIPVPGLPGPGTPTRPVVTNYSNVPTYTQGGVQTFLTDPRFAQFRDTLNLFPRV